MDPDLMKSIHLEGNPRRDMFRQVRERIAAAAGSHTVAGEVRLRPSAQSPEQLTLVPAEVPVKQGGIPCWIMDRGRKLPLKIGMNSVGRLPDNDVVIDDATVSRRHCAILVHSDLTFELHDVASKNGTLLNNRKIAGPTQLKDGDEITLCERRLIFLVVAGGQKSVSIQPAVSQSWSGEHTQVG
jgi:hypothetical protein